MHDSAYRLGDLVMRTYCDLPNAAVLEIGAMNVNGCLRDFAPPTTRYVGLDLEPGPSVDLVIGSDGVFPVEDASFDLVMASSVFEHDVRFWETFLRMCRAAKPGGHIYVNAPSNGMIHRYPVDCWRFYPDAGMALAGYARAQGLEIDLIESFVARQHGVFWNDFVAVFRRGPSAAPLNTKFVFQRFASMNARTWQSNDVHNALDDSEDMALIAGLREEVAHLAGAAGPGGALQDVLAKTQAYVADLEVRLQSQRDGYEAQSRQLADERDAAQAELRVVGAQHAEIAGIAADWEARALSAEQYRADYQGEVQRLEALLETAVSADDLHFRLQSQREGYETQSYQLAAERDAAQAALQAVGARHEEIAGLAADWEARARSAEQYRVDYEGEVERLGGLLDAAGAERARQEGDHAAHLQRLVAQLAAAEAAEDAARTEAKQAADLVASLESNLRQRQEEISQAWAEAAAVGRDRDGLREEGERLRLTARKLEERLAKADGWVFQLAGERRALEQQLAGAQRDVAAARRGEAAVTVKLDRSIDQARRAAATAARDATRQKEALHEDIARLIDRLVAREDELRAADAQLANARAVLESVRVNGVEFQRQAAAAQRRVDALQAQQDEQREARETAEHHLDAAERKLRWLRRLHRIGLDDEAALRAEGIFDRAAYLALHPDVADWDDPLQHYLLHGIYEGRTVFVGATYLALNPDVAEGGSDPLEHYLAFGREEGRRVTADE